MEIQMTSDKEHIVAFMDLGTNSVRLLVAKIQPDHSATIITEQREVVRLGEGEFRDMLLREEAMNRAVLVCGKFAEMAKANGAEEIVAVATSATRDAENQQEFLEKVASGTSLDLRVISGKEEARLIYLGVSSGITIGNKQTFFMDIGGGSTELILGDQVQHRVLDSLKLGAIRLSTMFFLPEEKGAVAQDRYGLICQYIRNSSIRTLQTFQQYRKDMAVGSSGTIVNLAEIAGKMFPRENPSALYFTWKELKQIIERLCALPVEERKKIPGINPDRADIIIPGAAIIDIVMKELEIKEMSASRRGLRDGLLVDYISRMGGGRIFHEMTVRERSIYQLGRAYNISEAHARHVSKLSLSLFDSAKKEGLHDLGDRERELLHYGAMLHDAGTFLTFNNHHAHTYYILKNSELLGFDQKEISMLAAIGFFHRKKYPRKKHPEYSSLDKNCQKTVRILSAFVRLSESLDRCHNQIVESASIKKAAHGKAIIEIACSVDCQLEIWGTMNHAESFKRAFGLDMDIVVIPH